MAMTLRLTAEQDHALTLLASAQGTSKHEAVVRAIVAAAARTLADAHIAYHRFGHLLGDPHGANNVILVEHALTGDSNVTEWWADLVGPGKALDTTKWCIIATNALGGCAGSTGPASPRPDDGRAWGSRFPALSVRDLVEAERAALYELGITHVHAVIGGSMGGARTLEWTLMRPDFLDAACGRRPGRRVRSAPRLLRPRWQPSDAPS